MAVQHRRKVESREEAERLFGELKKTGGDLPSFCSARGLDGRSLNCWGVNLGLAPIGRTAARKGATETVRVVEVVPAVRVAPSPGAETARYRVVVGQLTVEVDDHFREDTLARLLDVVRSC